jgi:hypothetical protein
VNLTFKGIGKIKRMTDSILPKKMNGKGGMILGGSVGLPTAVILYYLISQNTGNIESNDDSINTLQNSLHKIDKNVVVLCTKLDAKCSP